MLLKRGCSIFLLCFLLCFCMEGRAQIGVSSQGKEFMMAFSQNFSSPAFLKVFITAQVATSGTISAPQQAYSQTFSVGANQVTTINVPVADFRTNTNEVIDSTGLFISTNDPVSVYAWNFMPASADASRILPISSLGTEYRIATYESALLGTLLLVAATEDSTVVEITPSAPTFSGLTANSTITVTLDRGQTYQLRSEISATADFTGTVVRSLSPDKPIAVFGGSRCTNIPSNCGFCDMIYDQSLPVSSWGNTYYVVPIKTASRYTYRVIANANNTQVTIDGGVPIALNAGEIYTSNADTGAHCVSGNKPISVVQYLEGEFCSGIGDPSMMVLNSQEEQVEKATFSAVNSVNVQQHFLNIVIETSQIGQLTLDGVAIPVTEFDTFAPCPAYSYAQITLQSAGSHTLNGNGTSFAAYVYGIGAAESYGYSVGSNVILDLPTTLFQPCRDQQLSITADTTVSNVIWSKVGLSSILGTGNTLDLTPPLSSGLYAAMGDPPGANADTIMYFEVEVVESPFRSTFADISDTACATMQVPLETEMLSVLLYESCDKELRSFQWDTVAPHLIGTACGSPTNNAIYFDDAGSRELETTDFDLSDGGVVQFELMISNGGSGCSDANIGEEVVLEYSTNGGTAWNILQTFPVNIYDQFTPIEIQLPPAAETATTRLRWRQLNHSGIAEDVWALDEISVLTWEAPGMTYSYNWSPGTTLSDSTIANPLADFDPLLSYSIFIQDSNGCAFKDTLLRPVQGTYPPNISFGNDTALCEGDSLSLSVTSITEVSYLWGDSSTSSSHQALHPGQYFVTVTNTCGSTVDSIQLDSLIAALVQLGPDTTLCAGDSFVLDASISKGVYTWHNNSTNAQFQVSNPGLYWCEASNVCGTHRDTIDIIHLPQPNVHLDQDTALCVGDSLVANAYDTLSSYSWQDGSTAATYVIKTSGVYRVTLTNSCGLAEDTITTEFFHAPSISLGPDSFLCPGGVQGYAFQEPYAQYHWSDGTSDASFNIGSAGTYWLQVHNVCGADSDTVQLASIPYPFVDLGADTSLCESDTLALDATFADASYLWSNGQTMPTFQLTETGNYWVAVSNACGTFTDSLLVSESDSIQFDLGGDLVLCPGATTLLTTGLDASVHHIWNGSVASINYPVSQPGLYWVQASNSCGQQIDSIWVHPGMEPSVSIGRDQQLCRGDSLLLDASFAHSTYLWSTGAQTASITVTQPDTYQVTVSNACGTDNASIKVYFIDSLTISLGADRIGCQGVAEVLKGAWNVKTDMLWSNGSTQKVIEVDQPGEYWVEASNLCGLASDTIVLDFHPRPSVRLNGPREVCVGEAAQFVAEANWPHISWSNGTLGDTLNTILPGAYWASMTNACGTASDTVMLRHRNHPVVHLGRDQLVCPDEPVQLKVPKGMLDWTWEDGSKVSSRWIADAGTYSLWVSDDLGCEGGDSIVLSRCPSLWVPNAFTPRGDGLNDVFKPVSEGLQQYRFSVYNRWGQLLFETTNLREGWNGRVQGELAQSAAYVWRVEFVNRQEKEEVRTGSFTLIR